MTLSVAEVHVQALVGRARARLRLTRVARVLSLALPLILAAAAVAGWAGLARGEWLAASALASTLVTAAIAVARTPSTTDVAALLDARLRLADRVSTALQMMRREDAIARFIVQDAAAKLAPQAVVSALPFQIHPRAMPAAAFSLACVALWLAVPAPANREDGPAGGGLRFGGAAAARVGAESQPARNAGAAPAGSRPVAEPQGARADIETAVATKRDATPADSASGPESADAASRARPGDAPASGPRGTQEARGRITGAGPGSAVATTESGREGAGGVQRGTLTGTVEARSSSTNAPARAAVARARDAGEAAIAHDDVPPHRWAYLREYYRALGRLNQP